MCSSEFCCDGHRISRQWQILLVVLGTLAVLSNLPPEEAEGTALERRL
jgi:hypothetical protein